MSSATVVLTQQLGDLSAEYDRQQARILAEVRRIPEDLRADETATRNAGLAQQFRAQVDVLAGRLWGWPDGVAWAEAERAAEALREAKAASAERVNWARLALEKERVGKLVGSFFGLGELREWYDRKADSGERLALAYAADEVKRRWGASDFGVSAFVRQLENDRDASLKTPTVERLEAELQARLDERVNAYTALKNAVGRCGLQGPFTLSQAATVFRAIDPGYHVEPETGQQVFEFEHIMAPEPSAEASVA